jgi:hypothetical protein
MRFAIVSKSLQDAARSGIIDPKAVLGLAVSGLSGILPGEGSILVTEGTEATPEDRDFMVKALRAILTKSDGSPAITGLGGSDKGSDVRDYVGLPIVEQVRRLDALCECIQTGKANKDYDLRPNGVIVSGNRRTVAALVAWVVTGLTIDWPVETVEQSDSQTLEDVAFIHNTRHGENTDRVSMVRYIAGVMSRRPSGVSRREVQDLCGLTKGGSLPQSVHNWARVIHRDRLSLADCEKLRPYLSKQALASEILEPAKGIVGIDAILKHCEKGPTIKEIVEADFAKRMHDIGWCQDAISALMGADGAKNYLAKYRQTGSASE